MINDCPSFYLTLLEYNCVSIVDKSLFILQLLKSVSIHSDNELLFNTKDKKFINVCEYFLTVVQFAHYYYSIAQLYSIVDQHFFPQLIAEQSSEQVESLRKQLDVLRSTPLKLTEITRKLIRMKINIPTKEKFEQIGLTGHLIEYLSQSTF